MREELTKFQSAAPCETCKGQRLRPEALAVKIDGKTISDVAMLGVDRALAWARDLPAHLTDQQNQIAKAIMKESSSGSASSTMSASITSTSIASPAP